MSKATSLFFSAAITAFIIAAVGVLIWQARLSDNANAAPALVSSNQTSTDPATELAQLKAMNSALLQREKIYQQRLTEATQVAAAPLPESTPAEPARLLTQSEAIEIALAYNGGGRVREVEFKDEDGYSFYEVKIGRSEVDVDAFTGEVITGGGEDDYD